MPDKYLITSPEKKTNRHSFGKNFAWGVSSSAYQTEGAFDTDEKGASVWDEFTTRKRKIFSGHHARTSCDFYNKYQEDISIINSLSIPNFRFSISWSRLLPQGTGTANQRGIDFYNRVIDVCLAKNVTPWITLYHWDLPLILEQKGGWVNRDILNWFGEYASLCIRTFGDRVSHWMILNEPMVFTGAGYFLGLHAPGKKGLKNFLPAAHHAVLCQSAGLNILKKERKNMEVGSTFSCSYITPYSNSEKDIVAAKRIDALLNRMFIEPALGLNYPDDDLPLLRKMEPYIKQGDIELMKAEFDFIGIQNYTREAVSYSFLIPYVKARIIPADKRKVYRTMMNWEVYPESIYHMIKKFDSYPQIKKIIITENGAAFDDKIENGVVNDTERIHYLQEYIEQVYLAKQEGCKVEGYFVWSLTDNFEWADGYHPRFGLVHIDFENKNRVIKDSGFWYKNFLDQS